MRAVLLGALLLLLAMSLVLLLQPRPGHSSPTTFHKWILPGEHQTTSPTTFHKWILPGEHQTTSPTTFHKWILPGEKEHD